jgi:hypothetical protein
LLRDLKALLGAGQHRQADGPSGPAVVVLLTARRDDVDDVDTHARAAIVSR